MAINKVIFGGSTLIDLTSDTVTSADHIVNGYVGHLADGTVVTGSGGGVDGDNLGYGTIPRIGSALVGSSIIVS